MEKPDIVGRRIEGLRRVLYVGPDGHVDDAETGVTIETTTNALKCIVGADELFVDVV
jgi:hypothetical protein